MRSKRPARRRRLTDEEFRTLADFRHALRRFLLFSESAARELGVTAQQYQALLALRASPAPGRLTVGELAERMCIAPHSAVGLVDRLAERGLVRRRESRNDRRQVALALTPQGSKVLEGLAEVHRAELRRIKPELRGVLEIFEA